MDTNKPTKAWLVGTEYSLCPDHNTMVVLYADTRNKAKMVYLNKEAYQFDFDDLDKLYTKLKATRQKEDDLMLYKGQLLHRYVVEEKMQYEKRDRHLHYLGKKFRGKKVRIWSGQWDAYWKSNHCGYTSEISVAGLYDIREGIGICRGVDLRKRLKLEIIK